LAQKSLIATAGLSAASTYIQRAQANPTVRRELQMSLSPDFQLENSFDRNQSSCGNEGSLG
jgi:histidinol-phosphate aminotransferase